MNKFIELEDKYGAHSYLPLPVVLTKGEGVFVWDVDGNKYIDMMSAYSAVSQGHCHPRLVKALTEQAKILTLPSRAFYSDKLAGFLKRICELTGQEYALPMNTGAEAVETALKAVRKWAYTVKGVAKDEAEIISCEGNFHGRTLAVLGMSNEEVYRENFGPFLKGFKSIPYGDTSALEKSITKNTAAFFVEPIQGEGGIIIPPVGYLKKCAEICKENNVLLICDEIQTGLGRTGKFLASEHEGVKPDGLILGKALSGGMYPISMFLAKKEVMDVFTHGTHGSTYGGNPLASVVGVEALNIIVEEKLADRSAELGEYMLQKLQQFKSPLITDVRGKGLFIAVEIDQAKASARDVCLQLLEHGVLSKETHQTVVRFAPPLVVTKDDIDFVLSKLEKVLTDWK